MSKPTVTLGDARACNINDALAYIEPGLRISANLPEVKAARIIEHYFTREQVGALLSGQRLTYSAKSEYSATLETRAFTDSAKHVAYVMDNLDLRAIESSDHYTRGL